eukprot:CAMPEP_0117421426 /NCGR_PEP_ID=MMETSP0758-20121206/2523_1 /TAXON_ID=63605 /ORGANISM="Percolomonas cosmopolitus, Strain AE-1 (ATCC 50343)" /LENGTH=518 /DNA_ID=CAMNT_0005203549 /DNA_START=20 /DNA_END=1572 /DNA_ORIENTATION=-
MGEILQKFVAEDEEELSCEVGDIIYIIEFYDDGWSMCEMKDTGAKGIVPTEFFKIIATGLNTKELEEANRKEDALKLLAPFLSQYDKRLHFKKLYMSERFNKQRKRLHAMKEFMSTAHRYLNDLEKVRLWDSARTLLSEEEQDRLFYNIDELAVDARHTLESLQEEEQNFPQSYYAHRIIEIIPDLRRVGDFINFTSKHNATINEYKSKHKQFKKKMDSILEETGTPLESLLITPFQRITRIKGLLETIIKYTPEHHVEYKDLKYALSDISKVNKFVNETARKMQSSSTENEVVSEIRSQKLVLLIKDENRKMVLQDEVTVTSEALSLKNSKCKVFLMNDALILSYRVSKKTVEYFFHLSFAELKAAKSPLISLNLFSKNHHFDIDMKISPVYFNEFRDTISDHIRIVNEALSQSSYKDSYTVINRRTACSKQMFTMQQKMKMSSSSVKDVDKTIRELQIKKADIEKQILYFQKQLDKIMQQLEEADRQKMASINPADQSKLEASNREKSKFDTILLS